MNDRQKLAAMNFCREFLYFQDILTDAENEKIHTRIKKFQDKHRIEITESQLMSVTLNYDDITTEQSK